MQNRNRMYTEFTEIRVTGVQQHDGTIDYQVYECTTHFSGDEVRSTQGTCHRMIYSSKSERKALRYANKVIKAGIIAPREILKVRLNHK